MYCCAMLATSGSLGFASVSSEQIESSTCARPPALSRAGGTRLPPPSQRPQTSHGCLVRGLFYLFLAPGAGTLEMVSAGLQLSLRMSRQIAPEELMLPAAPRTPRGERVAVAPPCRARAWPGSRAGAAARARAAGRARTVVDLCAEGDLGRLEGIILQRVGSVMRVVRTDGGAGATGGGRRRGRRADPTW
jgi:hypothetical protein